MPITVFIQGTSIGTDAGPFNIYHTSVDVANQLGSNNYTRTQIVTGLTFNNVPDGTNDFYIVSSGICGNQGTTTLILPTNSPTASPTAAPVTPAPIAPVYAWDCLNGVCTYVGTGGIYVSQAACLLTCEQQAPAPTATPAPVTPSPTAPPPPTATSFDWECVNGNCVYMGPGQGIYISEAECQQYCFGNEVP